MSDETKVPSGSSPEAGGQKEDGKKADVVKYETHAKLLAEKKKLKEDLERFKAEERQRQEAIDAEKGEYKKLWETTKTEAEEAKTQLQQEIQARNDFVKTQKLVAKIDGRVDPKYLDHLREAVSDVAIDPETGKIDELSLEKAAERFQKEHAILIQKPVATGTRDKAPAFASVDEKLDINKASANEVANKLGELLKTI